MKVEINPPIKPKRGSPAKVGNVYSHPWGRHYRVCLAVVDRKGTRPWNNVVLLHVNVYGEIVGCSNQPEAYVADHCDLVGHVKDMPSLKIEWNK